LPVVAPSFSSTPVATSISDLTLLTSTLPLAQCMGLEIGEIFRVDVSVLEDASLLRSKELTLVEPHLEKASFLEFYCDIVMGSDTHSSWHIDPVCYELFDSTPISSPFSHTTPS